MQGQLLGSPPWAFSSVFYHPAAMDVCLSRLSHTGLVSDALHKDVGNQINYVQA